MKILLLEDNPGDARLFQETLREIAALTFELELCPTLKEGLSALGAGSYDIGLLDLALPDAKGLESVRCMRMAAPEMPLIVLSALKDERTAVQSLQEGAQDYIVKGEFDSRSLWRALRYAMERQRLQLEIHNRSLVDDLTGLHNRKGFLNLAAHHVALARRTGHPFLVGFIDLDGMKLINDTFGHQEGNRALVEAANLLRDSFRQSDILSRLGGDEFAVLVSDANKDSVAVVIERVMAKVRTRNTRGNHPYELALSIGVAASGEGPAIDLDRLLQLADTLMYQHKQRKRAARGADPALISAASQFR